MKKSSKFLNLLLLLPIFTSCANPNNDENSLKNDYTNPYRTYTFLDSVYNNGNFNYIAETNYLLKTERGNSQTLKSFKIKNDNNFYEQKSGISELFGSSSLKRYFDSSTSQYGVSIGSGDLANDNHLTSSEYSNLSLSSIDTYFTDYGEQLNSLTNFIVHRDYEKLSFLSAKLIEESANKNAYQYEVNLENIKKTDTEDNNLDNFTQINAARYEEKEVLSFLNLAKVKVDSATFTLEVNPTNHEINKINVHEILKANTIEFDYSYETTFKTYEDISEVDSFYKNLKGEIDKAVEKANSMQKDELYAFYVDLNKKYQNLNYYTQTDSKVNALGGIYSQTVKGFKLKKDKEYFFQTVTTSAFVKKAELRYENETNEDYWLADGNDPDTSSTFGTVSSWNSWNKHTESEYLSFIGHKMNNITNFIVDENEPSKSFLDARYNEDKEFKIYTYDISVKEDENHIDATKDYKVEMDHMSGMGLPNFEYSTIEIYISKNNENINKIIQKEKYTAGSFTCDSVMTTYFNLYENVSALPNEITNTYNNQIGGN